MTTITEQQRGEDGRFVAQPPQQGDPATGAADGQQDASAETRTGEKAPAPSTPASDPYEVAAREFNAPADTVVSDRTATPAATQPPQPVPANAGPATTPPPSPSTDAAPPTPEATAAAEQAAAAKTYDGMSAKTYNLLKSVPGGLVAQDEWAAMDVTERVAHVAEVTEFRNQQKRQYNERQRQPQAAPQDSPTELGQPPQAQGARVSGVRQQQQPAPSDGAAIPADVQAQLSAMAAEIGEESPVYKAFVRQAENQARLENQLAQRDRQFEAQANKAAHEQRMRLGEDQVFDQLETKYPPLSDPRKRDELRQVCRDWYQLRSSRDPSVNAVAVIEDVVKRSLLPEIQQRQTQRDNEASAKVRAGSFDRGAPVPPRGKAPAAGGDPYAIVAKELNQAHAEGISGDAAVDRALQLAKAAQR